MFKDNSSTALLDADEVYTGDWVDVQHYGSVTASCLSDTEGTMYMDFAIDPSQTNADSSLAYDVAANTNEVHSLVRTRQFFRVRFVNSSTAQTSFQISAFAEMGAIIVSPLNLTLGQDADAIPVRSVPVEFDIAQGKKGGVAKANKLGKCSDIDTGTVPEFVTELGGVYSGFPVDTAETITISSSSANDTAAGTGARTVRIIGLDSDWNIVSETITLNGTTGVATTTVFRRAHTMFVTSAGSNDFNEGTITATHTTTTSNVFLTIIPEVSSSNFCVYTVPANKIGIVVKYTGSIRRGASTSVDGAFWIRTFEASPRYRRPWSIGANSPLSIEPYGGIRFAEKTDIAMVVTEVSQNNTAVTTGFDIILVDN